MRKAITESNDEQEKAITKPSDDQEKVTESNDG
jgi:hypothetical protein